MSKFVTFFLVLAFVAPDAFARCGPSRLNGGVTRPQVIALNAEARGVRDAPAFYLRVTNPWVMLYFKPEDVVAALKPSDTSQKNEYFDRISKDLPLKENTDLFKYVLENTELFHRQSMLVSDLLKLGQVYVDDWPFGAAKRDPLHDTQDPTTLLIVSKMLTPKEEEWRVFCEPFGKKGDTREIFDITYVIVDQAPKTAVF